MGACQCRRRFGGELASECYDGGALSWTAPAEWPPRSGSPSTETIVGFEVGVFKVSWHAHDRRLTVHHIDRPERTLWSNVPGRAFLTAGAGMEVVKAMRDGIYTIRDHLQGRIAVEQVLKRFEHDVEGAGLTLSGSFSDAESSTWQVRFSVVDDLQLSIQASASMGGQPCNRLCFVLQSRAEEQFFGFGCQFTHMHMKGRRVPVLSSEPGIGRGIQPLTTVMERFFGAGGEWYKTYAPTPMCLSTDLRGICLENMEYSCFDFEMERSIRIGAFSDKLCSRLFCGSSPVGLLEAYTRFCGRMRPLPQWVQSGAMVGIQGGTEKVRNMVAALEAENVPISGIWMQDWVGRRKTGAGSQLWWTWEVDRELYPGWEELVAELKEKDIRVLTYINPMFVEASTERKLESDLHAEGSKEGYFIKTADGSDYPLRITTFDSKLLDLTNPGSREWVKSIFKEKMLGAGASGWMLDYAEALPFDACLHSNESASTFHNAYPIEWAKVCQEALEEAGRLEDTLVFARSGWHRSPTYATCFWIGDQLVSWRVEDGIKSVVVALVSSGMCGMTLNHGDIGGYTSTKVSSMHIPFFTFTRSQELLMRWAELCAFTAVYRSHEGNVPGRNHQINDHPDTIAHFGRFARVYAALGEYRSRLCEEAAQQGLPLVRHPWLHYPADPVAATLKFQFLLGPEFLVAPVLDKMCEEVCLYLPTGRWVHLWSSQEVAVEGPHGIWGTCSAPVGCPPVFYLSSSSAGRKVAEALAAGKDLGPAWTRRAFTIDAHSSQASGLDHPAFDSVGDSGGQLAKPQARGRWVCCASRRSKHGRGRKQVVPVCDAVAREHWPQEGKEAT